MFYTIRHVTRFRYSAPVSQSVMEVRMQPRSDGTQRNHKFEIRTAPPARIRSYRDYLGNVINYFDIPGRHTHLTITTEALVETNPAPLLPDSLGPDAWEEVDRLADLNDNLDYLMPSHFARPTFLLDELARELDLRRRDDPLRMVLDLNRSIHDLFDYDPDSTHVHSPIDDALRARRGVCQDFAHIMIALLRRLGIPARYISGYLFHRREDHDRSEADASHAWVDVMLPGIGWIGFDPTNNLIDGERHIRVAIGRDYADVPPTRGVFKGVAHSDLAVAVRVLPTEAPPVEEELLPVLGWIPPPVVEEDYQHQQQQQQ